MVEIVRLEVNERIPARGTGYGIIGTSAPALVQRKVAHFRALEPRLSAFARGSDGSLGATCRRGPSSCPIARGETEGEDCSVYPAI